MEIKSDPKQLIELAHYKMPFGKHKGRYLVDLPLPYLVWFGQKGFPKGKLGNFLQLIKELKDNGMEGIVRKIQRDFPKE